MFVKLRAMLGRCICLFHIYQQRDAHFERQKNITRCVDLLSFLQMLMELVLPIESLYWIIYNGKWWILQQGIDVTYSPDVTKAIAVKSNKYTTRHISKGGRFLHLKNAA